MDRDTPYPKYSFLWGVEAGPRSTRRPAKLLRQEHDNGCRRMSSRSSVCKQDKRVGDPQNIAKESRNIIPKPIFDSQRQFLLGRCSPGAASRAIEVLLPQKCSAISSSELFSKLLW